MIPLQIDGMCACVYGLHDYVFFNGTSCLVVDLLDIPHRPMTSPRFVAFVI